MMEMPLHMPFLSCDDPFTLVELILDGAIDTIVLVVPLHIWKDPLMG